LVAACDEGHAAVGPLMRNANPAASPSRAGLFLRDGCCVHPARHAGHVNISRFSYRVRHAYWGGRLCRAMRAQARAWSMIAGPLPHAPGEAFGYALGAGDAWERCSSCETKRYLHVVVTDRERMSA